MNTTPDPTKNEMIGVPCADAPNKPAEHQPTAADDRAAALVEKRKHQARWPEPASAARDRLREATKEAFPRGDQYRPPLDGTGIMGSGKA